MIWFIRLSAVLVFLNFSSCKTAKNVSGLKDDRKIEIVFLQVNDVYEIAPLSGGKEGGMARVASLKKKYQKQNPNTFLVMAGDFLSPSVYNSLQYEGKRIRGRQMIEAMNTAGVDLAVFGNHEFDITEPELLDRIKESHFTWIASNTFHKQKSVSVPFVHPDGTAFPKTYILHVKDADGTEAKIGFIGITLPFNKADYVSYTEPLQTAKELYHQIKDSVDAVIAITHQLMEDDIKMVQEVPGFALVIGGHEHDMRFEKIGNVFITKAHANAKSAYVVKLKINKKKGKIKADPELKYINENISLDSTTNAVVEKWTAIAEKNYASLGFDARRVILKNSEPLDGRETEVRSRSTNLTKLIITAMKAAAPQADVVMMNSGSIRVDDIIQMPVTQYDIIRALPFGGGIREADMKGSLLIKALDAGKKNRGIGGFLQFSEQVNFDEVSNTWKLNNVPIEPAKTYRIAMSDFLFTGREANLDFLNPKNEGITKVYDPVTAVSDPRSDIRLAVIMYLEKSAQ